MLLPIGIEYGYQRTPYATLGLIGACTMIFGLQLVLPESAFAELMCFPDTFKPWQWITAVFLHGGILHLVGNMVFLWVYGRYVEERLGPWRFLAAYLGLGVVASWAFIGANLGDPIPAVGASGAISGLMGLVLAVAASAKVDTVLIWGYLVRRFEIHAGFLLGFWMLEQLFMAAIGVDGVAISAHLGGFAAGFGLGLLLRHESLRGSAWYMDDGKANRESARMASDAELWGEVASYHRHERTQQRKPPMLVEKDPYEEELLKRWNDR